MNLIFLILFLTLPQAGFEHFSFCRENARGPYALQCFDLDASGEGMFKFTPRDADTEEIPIRLSSAGTRRFVELLAETNYLEQGDRYESNRRVADLGRKTLVAEGPWGRREAVFNYSQIREVTDLVAFFERLAEQELLVFDIEVALDFDRLGIPERLDRIEKDLDGQRLVDPGRLVPVLDKIAADPRLVNFARRTAARLKEQIENSD